MLQLCDILTQKNNCKKIWTIIYLVVYLLSFKFTPYYNAQIYYFILKHSWPWGGDDLYQFYEASDSEFYELMVLVGMAGKPSHVRRFKLGLYEWARNQSLFQLRLALTTEFSWVYTIATEE